MPSISLIIPAYNEHRRLRKTLNSVIRFLKSSNYEWEIIVINDGSTDDTADIAYEFAKNEARIKVIDEKINRGKGAAVKEGVLAAMKDVVVITDADQATPLSELPKFLTNLNNVDGVIGSRYLPESKVELKQSLSRRILSRVGNLIIRFSLNLPYTDTQCGFKVFKRNASRRIFKHLTIKRWGFDIELLAIARLLNLKIIEIPITWHDQGDSKLHTGRAAWSTFQELMLIRRNLGNGTYSDTTTTESCTENTEE